MSNVKQDLVSMTGECTVTKHWQRVRRLLSSEAKLGVGAGERVGI